LSHPRVIAGKAKGLRLKDVPGNTTRPITDRVKEALFNIISADIVDATFLDLFGGTGSVGIEALSRGAKLARFIEINRSAVAVIKANLKHTSLDQYAEVIQDDTLAYLKNPPDSTFDYVYIAPPQYKEIWKDTLGTLDANPGWLSPDAWVVVQIHPVEIEDTKLDNIVEFDQRQYGSTMLVFYEAVPSA